MKKYVIKIGPLYMLDIIFNDKGEISSIPMVEKEKAKLFSDKKIAGDVAEMVVGEVEEVVINE